MKLIHFRGLNCYTNSIVSVASAWGARYELAFSALWSETDFEYAGHTRVFSSKRMLARLEALGAGIRAEDSATAAARERSLSLVEDGAVALIGMDAFDIPWSPIYGALHDPHYFIAVRGRSGHLTCFDPTYGRAGVRITHTRVVSRAFDIRRMVRTTPIPLAAGIPHEAEAVLRCHPRARETLLRDIRGCAGTNRQGAVFLARHADALITNRYLFARFLQGAGCEPPFDGGFFSRWEAAKNGLYKAALVRDNARVIAEVCALADGLLAEEAEMARRMLTSARAAPFH